MQITQIEFIKIFEKASQNSHFENELNHQWLWNMLNIGLNGLVFPIDLTQFNDYISGKNLEKIKNKNNLDSISWIKQHQYLNENDSLSIQVKSFLHTITPIQPTKSNFSLKLAFLSSFALFILSIAFIFEYWKELGFVSLFALLSISSYKIIKRLLNKKEENKIKEIIEEKISTNQPQIVNKNLVQQIDLISLEFKTKNTTKYELIEKISKKSFLILNETSKNPNQFQYMIVDIERIWFKTLPSLIEKINISKDTDDSIFETLEAISTILDKHFEVLVWGIEMEINSQQRYWTQKIINQ